MQLAEMLPASGLDRNEASLVCFQQDGRPMAGGLAEDADAVDGHAGEGAGDLRGGRGGEEQFVIFAAVEGEVEGG